MHRPDPYAMADEMGYSLMGEWRAYFDWKNEMQAQEAAAARAEAASGKPRGKR